jgi:hypothetical protein
MRRAPTIVGRFPAAPSNDDGNAQAPTIIASGREISINLANLLKFIQFHFYPFSLCR